MDFQDKGSGGARSRIVAAVLAWILFGAGMIALVTSIRTGPLEGFLGPRRRSRG